MEQKSLETKQRFALLPIFLTVFIDLIGIGIIIPILAVLFLQVHNGILPESYSLATRTILLGALIASYPLMQFFGAPLLGGLSDKYGRKKMLIISLTGSCLGYLLFGIGVATKNVPLLFLSRIIDGFTGGNISIALAAIADISTKKDKAKNFGLIGMAFGLGFILGPFIGGKLSDNTLVPWFTFATPFWFAAALSFANIVLFIFFFKETLKTKIDTKISILTGFRNIKKAWNMADLRIAFIVTFLLTLGFTFYTQFFQVYLIQTFSYTQSDIGNYFAYVGLCIALTQGVLTRIIGKKYLPEQILTITPLILAIAIFSQIIPEQSYFLYFITPFIAIGQGLTYPNTTALISNLADEKSQGEILGINQSIQALGMAIPPIIAGIIVSLNKHLPVIIASCIIFISWIVFLTLFKKKTELFHEVEE